MSLLAHDYSQLLQLTGAPATSARKYSEADAAGSPSPFRHSVTDKELKLEDLTACNANAESASGSFAFRRMKTTNDHHFEEEQAEQLFETKKMKRKVSPGLLLDNYYSMFKQPYTKSRTFTTVLGMGPE